MEAPMSRLLSVALLLVAACASAPPVESPGIPHSLAFDGVAVVDVSDGVVLTDQTVLIEGSRITAVGPTGRVSVPPSAHVVDGRGKYLIPGPWDMHVHSAVNLEWHFPLLSRMV
jgi:adenine deaminase